MVLVLAIYTFLLFANTFANGFITGDDYTGFIQNDVIKNVLTAAKTFQLNHVYFALIYRYVGTNAFYMHFFSVIFHILVVLLVYKCFDMAFNKKTALIAAFLFAIHPIVTETVDWISATPYLFNALVAFGTLFLFLKYKKTSKKFYLFLSQGVFAFSTVFFRSPWILATPLIITAFELFIMRTDFSLKTWKGTAKNLWVFYIISMMFFAFSIVGLIAIRQQVLKTEYFMDLQNPDPLYIRLIYPTFMAIKLLLIPTNLTLYHEGEFISTAYLVWMIFVDIFYIGMTLFIWKKNKIIAAILTLMLLMLLPVYIPQLSTWMVAERYLYIPVAFFCLLVAKLIIYIEHRVKIQHFSVFLTTILLMAYSLVTFQRNYDWKDNKTFWLKTAEASPKSYRAYNNAGDAFATDKDLPTALKYFLKAVEINDKYADGWHNVGFTYMQMGDLPDAKLALEKSFRLNPQLYQATYKLGFIEFKLGNKTAAKKYIQKTLELKPNYEPALQTMALLDISQ